VKTLSGIEGEPIYFQTQDSQESCLDTSHEIDGVFDVFVDHPFSENETQNMEPHDRTVLTAHLQDELTKGSQALHDLLRNQKLDLLEVCAPWDSPLSSTIRSMGGKAYSIGNHNGFDLSTRKGFLRAANFIREFKPGYLHVSPPCFPWSPLQNCNQRTVEQRQALEEKRQTSKRILKHCRKLIEIQLYENNEDGGLAYETDGSSCHAGGEHPLRAQSWSLDDMRTMLRMCGPRFAVHGCRHGLVCRKTGELIQKPWGWFSTHKGVRDKLAAVCNHGTGVHKKIEGSITASTAVYPPLLCRRFAEAILAKTRQVSVCFSEYDVDDVHGHVFAEEGEEDQQEEQPVIDLDGSQEMEEQEGGPGDEEQQEQDSETEIMEIKQKLKMIHRNLGHPNNEAMLKMLRDSGANKKVLDLAKDFSCEFCLQRGRRAPARPSTVTKVTEKWHCLSIDTFWWHTPKEVLRPGEKPVYALGLSIMDEATDFHAGIILKTSTEGALRNISAEDFKKGFSKGWLQQFPAPSLLRYDEEGFMRSVKLVSWLEIFGIKLEPISGEGSWQLGKHSRHLQTLKEQMNLICFEMGNQFDVEELLGLSLSAKNSMHQIRGFSPYQWAFGQNHGRISSFLQNSENLPLHSAREDQTFEEKVQAEANARKLFLEIDARRRIARALHAKSRTIREFTMGDLVYFFRKGIKQGSRYGGTWHGPARVLAHEKTSHLEEQKAPGSVVWITHAGKIIRCAPEQLRHVTHDLRHLDKEINGPQNFHTMLEQVSNQLKYLDISQEYEGELFDEPDERMPQFRAREKQTVPPEFLGPRKDPPRDAHGDSQQRPETAVRSGGQEEAGAERTRSRTPTSGRIRRDENDSRRTLQGSGIQGDLQRPRIQQMGGGSLPRGEVVSGAQGVRDLHEPSASEEDGRDSFKSGDLPLKSKTLKKEVNPAKETPDETMSINKRIHQEEESEMGSHWTRVEEVESEVIQMKHRLSNMENMMEKFLHHIQDKQ